MPRNPEHIVWKADPHTIAKVEILKNYLTAWFSIFGMTRRAQAIVYIDGFAGPGEYTNYSAGSPIAAVDAANRAIVKLEYKWIAGDVYCFFIDDDERRTRHLEEKLKGSLHSRRIHTKTITSSFSEGVDAARSALPEAFEQNTPLFAFIDPFGISVPFSKIASILRSPCSEVLINLDADGADRVLRAGQAARADENLTMLFGSTEWRDQLACTGPLEQRCRSILHLYKRQLLALPNVDYVFSFEMRSIDNSLNYYLVFASQYYLGLEKMKESMRRIGQEGGYCFSDANIGQLTMFGRDEEHEIKQFSELMFQEFSGSTQGFETLRRFALNETPFLNPAAMLAALEDRQAIRVRTTAGAKRRGKTFSPEVIESVSFTKELPHNLFES